MIGLIVYSFAFTQEMPGMDMQKKETKTVQPVTYTCVMHPEIHAAKPGNCPKCGMVLIKEKPKVATKPAAKKAVDMRITMDTTNPKAIDKMKMQKDSSIDKSMDMGNMNMHNMPAANPGVFPQKTIIKKTAQNSTVRSVYKGYDG